MKETEVKIRRWNKPVFWQCARKGGFY